MNIKFMSEFYERFYDDPVFETIGQKEEYKEIKRRRRKIKKNHWRNRIGYMGIV